MNENIEEIALADVFLDRETQIRAAASEETIQRYYDVMVDIAARDKFPPILLFRDKNGRLWLVDGHHRVMSAIRRKFKTILAVIRPGSKADAIWEAAKLNSKNGLQLGRADVRRAVEMILMEWSDRSNRAIAEVVGCSHEYVRKVRESTGNLLPVEKTVGRDGKSRPAKSTQRSESSPASKTSIPEEPAELNLRDMETIVSDDPSPEVPSESESVVIQEDADVIKHQLEAANAKEQEVIAATNLLNQRIDEWFAVAPNDMWEAFDKRNRERIEALIR